MEGTKRMEWNIEQYGAVSHEMTYSDAIQQAVDAASAAGGGVVVVPTGVYYSKPIALKSNIELRVTAGATIIFSDRAEDYPVVPSRWEGVFRDVYMSCIYASHATNIAVTGTGTLDGNGAKWWEIYRHHREDLAYPRPKLFSCDDCHRVTVKDVTVKNSPSWTFNPIRSNNLTFENLTIQNPSDSPNTDGIDPESCTNVRISNCHIDVGDDCIAIKSGTEDTMERVACENITITNCTMVHGHGGVVLGSEMSGDIRNVVISNCVFQQTDRGIRLKSRRGRGGVIEDVRVTNIVMDEVLCPFIMNLYYFCGPKGKEKYVWDKNPYPITEETPTFRHLTFSNITAKNVHAAAGFIYGLAENYVDDVQFHDIDIRMAQEAKPGKPAMMTGITDMAKRGFMIGCAKNIAFHHVRITGVEGSLFEVEQSQQVEVNGHVFAS